MQVCRVNLQMVDICVAYAKGHSLLFDDNKSIAIVFVKNNVMCVRDLNSNIVMNGNVLIAMRTSNKTTSIRNGFRSVWV